MIQNKKPLLSVSILFLLSLLLAACSGNDNLSGSALEQSQALIDNNMEPVNQDEFEDLVSTYKKATLKTNQGDIIVEFFSDTSPKTVNNFLNLAQKGFYNDTKFHRIIKDFMIQGGDPLSKDDNWSLHGTGGPGYQFDDELNNRSLIRGSLAMANSGPDTNGSQFFLVTATSAPWLDGKHTSFGQVVEGIEVLDKIESMKTNEQDHPVEDAVIEEIILIEK